MFLCSTFPPEIWDEILDFVSPKDIAKIAQISSYLAGIVSINRNQKIKLFLFQKGVWEREYSKQLQCACKDGHLEVCRWLHSTFDLTRENARDENNFALQMAC